MWVRVERGHTVQKCSRIGEKRRSCVLLNHNRELVKSNKNLSLWGFFLCLFLVFCFLTVDDEVWSDGSVGTMFTVPACGPEFGSAAPVHRMVSGMSVDLVLRRLHGAC